MMKNENGITMISLMITVIALIILSSVGWNAAYKGINDAKDDKLRTELGVVRQAVVEQYSMAEAVNKTNKLVSEESVEFWVGTRINPSEIWEKSKLTNNITYYGIDENAREKSQECLDAFQAYSEKQNIDYQEDYYYLLSPENLAQIGVGGSKHSYIVNYKTGETFNATKKQTKTTSQLLYSPAIYENEKATTVDNETFNDWEEN